MFFSFICLSYAHTPPTKQVTPTLHLKASPWHFNADGKWIAHINVIENTMESVQLSASTGEVYIVPDWVSNRTEITLRLSRLTQTLPITVTARSSKDKQILATIILSPPIHQFSGLQFTVLPIGPYLINMAWVSLDTLQKVQQYRIFRKDDTNAAEIQIATVGSQQTTFHDNSVQPNHQYTYRLVAETSSGQTLSAEHQVTSPTEMKHMPITAMKGIGATLFFTTDPGSSVYFKKINPELLVQQAKKLNLKYIELRTAFGSYAHIVTPDQKQWVDKILDEASANGIAVFSWCIPQRETSTTLAVYVAMAAHTTSKGNTFAGIAVDLEIEKSYMQPTASLSAQEEIAQFVKYIRQAVGPKYLFSAIVYSPKQSVKDFPYRSIGKYATIVQPMEFWHYHLASKNHVYTKEEVTAAIVDSVTTTRAQVGINVPINIIGQITDVDDDKLLTGVPSAEEISTALKAAKSLGVLGVSFYNWNNKLLQNSPLSPQAQALKDFVW